MTKEQQMKFEESVRSCDAEFSTGTVYVDGGREREHGLPEGSRPCSCGHGRHYKASDGSLWPSVWDYLARRDVRTIRARDIWRCITFCCNSQSG